MVEQGGQRRIEELYIVILNILSKLNKFKGQNPDINKSITKYQTQTQNENLSSKNNSEEISTPDSTRLVKIEMKIYFSDLVQV
jgi:hypothetical protein